MNQVATGKCKACNKIITVQTFCERCIYRVRCLVADTSVCVPWFCSECFDEGEIVTKYWRLI